jgi:hypothetical protein
MPARPDILVFFPKFNGPIRIAFQVDIRWITLQAGQGKHFVHHLEYQYILAEGEAFGDAGFGQAVFADLFDVHPFIIYPKDTTMS